jgi:hypothetical protein
MTTWKENKGIYGRLILCYFAVDLRETFTLYSCRKYIQIVILCKGKKITQVDKNKFKIVRQKNKLYKNQKVKTRGKGLFVNR